jgi:hypothetical protein
LLKNMDDKSQLVISLVLFITCLVIIVRQSWNGKFPTTGLPIACVVLIALQHLPGALVHALPWYNTPNTYNTILGFTATTYAVMSLAFGTIIIAPIIINNIGLPWLKFKPKQPELGLAETYIYLGLILSLILLPILFFIPGLQAITGSGTSVTVVGLCLACWKSWYLQNQKSFAFWLTLSFCFPVITVATGGYSSYGSFVACIVLSFVLSFYRRNQWRTMIIGVLVLIFGLSYFVNYYRDRQEIRNIVWTGGSWEARIEQLSKTISTAEFFDPFNQKHLRSIDDRLNQNVLVGQAITYVSQGNIPFANGSTIVGSLAAAIPRAIWPEKPFFIGGFQLVAKYTGASELSQTSGSTSIAAGLPLEFYVNYGDWGIIIGYLILGVALKIIDVSAGLSLRSGNIPSFMLWFLPGITMAQYSADMGEFVSNTATVILLANILLRIPVPNFLKGKLSKKDQYKLYLIQQQNAAKNHR